MTPAIATAFAFGKGRTPQRQQPGAPSGQPVSGISCDAMEGQRLHTHQHLVILDRGKEVPIPPNVGQPLTRRCIYWVHTHTPDGIIHIESPTPKTYTLGNFFDIWQQPLSSTQVSTALGNVTAYVNGKQYKGDPRSIPLNAHAVIQLDVGSPTVPPKSYSFPKGL